MMNLRLLKWTPRPKFVKSVIISYSLVAFQTKKRTTIMDITFADFLIFYEISFDRK